MSASIGEQLRLAREQLGIPLRQISDQTRISVHYLEAIESNDYKHLPGGVFNRSFIKAYAKCVGYDEKAAIEGYTRYLREHGESSDEVATSPVHSKVYTDTPATRSPILTVVLAVLILGVLTFAALAVLHWYQRRAAVHPGNDHSSFVAGSPSGKPAWGGGVCKTPKDWSNETSVAISGLGLRKADYKAVLQ